MSVPETFFSIQEELVLFLLSCLAGAFIGVFYDIFRTLRLMIKHNFFFVVLEDVLFLSCYAVFLSSFASVQARGELRFYFIIGNVLGFTLYFFTLGSFVIRTLKKFFGLLGRIFSPVKAVYVIFCKKVRCKFVENSENFKNHIKKSKSLLPKHKILLYNKNKTIEKEREHGCRTKRKKSH